MKGEVRQMVWNRTKLKTSSTFPFSSYFLLISREKEVELEPLGRNCRRTLWSEVWIVTRLKKGLTLDFHSFPLSIAGIFFNFLKTQAKISGKTWRCKQMEIMLSQVLEGITKPVIIQERFELYQLMNLRSAMHRLMNL